MRMNNMQNLMMPLLNLFLLRISIIGELRNDAKKGELVQKLGLVTLGWITMEEGY